MRPNFFIVGAPKSGTTALSEYLKTHPDVCFSHPKEPHFFATDLPRYRAADTLPEYLRLFGNSVPTSAARPTRVGEGSVYYLYSEVALDAIARFADDPKVIVLLRNPVELVYSLHAQLLYNRDEDEPDFAKAWSLVQKRKAGQRIPRYCRDPKILFYDEIGKLGHQLARLEEILPETARKVIFFEDFVRETASVYREVLDFLGLDDDGRIRFERVNANRSHAIGWLGTLTEHPPKPLVATAMTLKNWLGFEQMNVLSTLAAWNRRTAPRNALPESLQRELVHVYMDDIRALERLTGRDLSHWLDVDTDSP